MDDRNRLGPQVDNLRGLVGLPRDRRQIRAPRRDAQRPAGRAAVKTLARVRDPFKFKKRGQLVVGVHNEALTVVAMCVSHEDRSPLAIHSCNTAPTPSGFAELVCNGLPVPLHALDSASFVLYTATTKMVLQQAAEESWQVSYRPAEALLESIANQIVYPSERHPTVG